MAMATRRAAGESRSSSTATTTTTTSSSSTSSSSKAAPASVGDKAAGSKQRTWGERLASEAAVLLILLGMELAWWHLRGRVSFAPTGSEAEDGQRLLSFALKWYAGARLALLAVGTGARLVNKLPRPLPLLLWTAAGAGAAVLGWRAVGGHQGIAAAAQANKYTFVLHRYVFLLGQQGFYGNEARMLGRILVALLAWQALLTVVYYAVSLLVTPVYWLFTGRRPQQKGKGAAKTSATAKPAAMAKGSGGSGGSKDVIAAEEED